MVGLVTVWTRLSALGVFSRLVEDQASGSEERAGPQSLSAVFSAA